LAAAGFYHTGIIVPELDEAAGTRIEIVDRTLFPDWPGFLESMAG
jgi:hypothetical protein